MVKLVDLSGYLEENQPVLPGLQRTQFWVTSSHEESGYATRQQVGRETKTVSRKLRAKNRGDTDEHPLIRTILVSEHGPTHVDAFSHLDPTSEDSIDRIPLERFYGDAIGVDVSHVSSDEFITIEDLGGALDEHDLTIADGDAITIHTGHRSRHYDVDDPEQRYRYTHDYSGLSEDAAYWLADQGVSNIGIDAPSIDHASALDSGEFPAHDMCAENDVLNMEHMANLGTVAGSRYTLAAFPLKIRGGTGSPIRPVAIVE